MDPATRRAALIATLVAVPVAILVGLLVLWLGGPGGAPRPEKSGAAPDVTSPVSLPARSLDPRAATECRGLLARLPDRVGGLARRPVTEGTEQNAAYGEPPVTVSCGAQPVVLPETSTATVYRLSGVCWYPEQTRDGTRWTTLDRRTPVVVTVPGSIEAPGQWVTAFSRYVVKQPEGGKPPTGCRA